MPAYLPTYCSRLLRARLSPAQFSSVRTPLQQLRHSYRLIWCALNIVTIYRYCIFYIWIALFHCTRSWTVGCNLIGHRHARSSHRNSAPRCENFPLGNSRALIIWRFYELAVYDGCKTFRAVTRRIKIYFY